MKKGKKTRRILLVGVLVIALLFVLSNFVLNKVTRTQYQQLDATDQQMLTELSRIFTTFGKDSGQLWSEGYRLDKKPLLLVRVGKDRGMVPAYGYAVNVEGMQDGLSAQKIAIPPALGLPDVYRVNSLSLFSGLIWFPSNFGPTTLQGEEVFYFKYSPQMMTAPLAHLDFPSFLIHESFHFFGQKGWRYDQGDGGYIEDYPNTKEQFALFGLEFSLLDQALAGTGKDDTTQIMREWLAVRNERYRLWPQLENETNTEAIEGTAEYMELRYTDLAGGLAALILDDTHVSHTFLGLFDLLAEKGAPSYLDRSIYYDTGAALGLIMDKMELPWRPMIEDSEANPGQAQYQILLDFLGDDLSSVNLEEVKARYHYDDLLRKGEQIVTAKQAE